MRYKVPMLQDHIFHIIEYYPNNIYNTVNQKNSIHKHFQKKKKKIGEGRNHPTK